MEAKRKKQLVYGAIGLVTILALYGLYHLITKKEDESSEDTSSSTSSRGLFSSKGFPLKNGSSGKDVMTLQRILNRSLLPPRALLVVDGKFGRKTEAAALAVLKTKTVSRKVFDREKSKHPDLIF